MSHLSQIQSYLSAEQICAELLEFTLTNPVLYMKNSVIFRTNVVIFRTTSFKFEPNSVNTVEEKSSCIQEKFSHIKNKSSHILVVWEYWTIFPDHANQENHLSPAGCPLSTTKQADEKSFSPGAVISSPRSGA